jgi:PRTRC genetic system protein E
LTGTPEEIDAELAEQLRAFVDSHSTLRECLDQAKQEIADAVKAVEERDKNRSKTRTTTVTKADEKSPDDRSEEPRTAADNLPLFEPKAAVDQK